MKKGNKKAKLNIADWISIYRIIAAPLLLTLLFADERFLFGIFLFISFFSDSLDGFVARRLNIVTVRGARLDSIGDAITTIIGVFGVVHFETEFVLDHLIVVIIIMTLYFLQILIAVIRYGKPSSFHTYLAKAAAIAVGIFMLWLFLVDVNIWLFYLAVILGAIETIEEMILTFVLKEWKADVKGLYWVLKDKSSNKKSPTKS